MKNSISDETFDEAQIITAEIWQSASSAEIMFRMLSESQLIHNSSHYTSHLYLFAASCARRVSHLLQDPRSYQAIRTAELFATNATTKTQLHDSHKAAKAAAIDLADRYNDSQSVCGHRPNHQSLLSRQTLYGGALLHAAAAASMACYPPDSLGTLQAAETSARYATNALYYEQLSYEADSTLISELIDEEQHHQSQALRIFLGNPFDPERWPPFTIPETHSGLKNRADPNYGAN
jgi:hypothetical protein